MPHTQPHAESGQASVETVALLPVLAVLAAIAWQAILAGQAVWLGGTAARAAARAAAVGRDPTTAARASLPTHLRSGTKAARSGEGVRVRIRIPIIVGDARLGTVTARAHLRSQQ